MRLALGLLAASCTLALFHCSSLPDPCRGAECGVAPDGSSEGGVDGGGDVVVPEGCDPLAEPKDSPKCVDDGFGVFVDATGGADGNAGTKSSPVKSVGAALGKLGNRSRVYVCTGTYEESVALTGAVSVYGGFACGSWTYGGGETKVSPKAAGYALEVGPVPGAVAVYDVTFASKDGTAPGESSIAVFVHDSPQVLLRRVTARAGKGVDASPAAPPASNLFTGNASGNPATGPTGAAPQPCTCPLYGASTGGAGGNGGVAADRAGKPGSNGGATPALPPPMGGYDGKGGAGAADMGGSSCGQGTEGASGEARPGGAGAKASGTVVAAGWAGTAGEQGSAGNPGQGGGGGGGDKFVSGGGGGGGGGCGGCGGAGGAGGKAGGSSIAVLSLTSGLRLQEAVLESGDAGRGGDGGDGGGGGGGGGGSVGACSGRAGGNGAGGSGGGGGAAGVSVGVVRKGGSLDGAPKATTGQVRPAGAGGGAGAAGSGGPAPTPGGAAGSAGKEGVAQAILEVTP